MRIVYTDEYIWDKQYFFKEHNNDFTIHTSELDKYNGYHKEYVFADGAVWFEVMSYETVKSPVEIYKCRTYVEVRLFRTEYWSTDDSTSRYYYQP